MRGTRSPDALNENRLRGGIGVFEAVARKFLGCRRRRPRFERTRMPPPDALSTPLCGAHPRPPPTSLSRAPSSARAVVQRDEVERTGREWWDARLRAMASASDNRGLPH
jgi:hypothetical protein